MGHSVQAPLHIVFESGARCPPGMPKGRQLTRRIGRAQNWKRGIAGVAVRWGRCVNARKSWFSSDPDRCRASG